MKTFIRKAARRLTSALSVAYYTAGAKLTVYAQTEPVRLRARILSVLVAVGTVVPALASSQVDGTIAGVLLTLVTLVTGEAARARVTPTNEK